MKTSASEQKIKSAFLQALLILIFLISFSCSFAGNKISGVITDGSGTVLPGASISLKGANTGTISDINGVYSIEVPDTSAILLISYIGYLSQEIVIGKLKNINVALVPDIDNLEEVVIGYGVHEKSMVAGAISHLGYDKRCAPKASYFEAEDYSSQVYFNPSTETYSSINENGFRNSRANPLSTFSIDVDRASYSNVKRFLNNGQVPPADAVRIEEMINYFTYDYPQPASEHPFSITTEYADCPWQNGHKLLHIGLQGKKVATENLPASNLIFLLDVSGSMNEPNKLPLLKSALKLLVNNLRENDRVAIVVYAGAAGMVLKSTRGSDKNTILDALDRLQAGGSTAGAEGIELAYKTALDNFIKGGNNRVILATDGDFNVGVSNENELEDLITDKRNSGVFLTCLGFGMGNYKDSKMEILADKGNGNYAYINDIQEANKVLVSEFGGTLFTIAKDVKIQVEFNPAKVQAYRLVGYENRMLNEEDFKDDKKDAGELGSGHTVTAIYEIIPVGVNSKFIKDVDNLKYQTPAPSDNSITGEVATVKFRYKKPDGLVSTEMEHTVSDISVGFDNASDNVRFASAISMFGMLLRNSEYKGNCSFKDVIRYADSARGNDKEGYRAEFVRLVKTAENGAFRTAQK